MRLGILMLCGLFLLGCTTAAGTRANVIEQLKDAGCIISEYKERLGKSVSVKCK